MSHDEMITLISVLNDSVKAGALSTVLAQQYIRAIVETMIQLPPKEKAQKEKGE